MKKIVTAIMPVMVLLVSCSKDIIVGNGNVETEQRTIANFRNIEVSGNTKVFITQGADFKVEVKAYSNLLPYLETKLEGDILKTGYKPGTNIHNDNSQLFITMPFLNGIYLYGNNDATTTGNFDGGNNLNIRITGNSSINLQQGSVANLAIDLNGNGAIHAFGFSATNAVVYLTGKGNIELTAMDKLQVTIRGNGNIYYKGSPVLTSDIIGTGRVERR